MAETVLEQIVATLRTSATEHYPWRNELRNVRVVGHTPKPDHYIYDIALDFADGSERVAAKVYRGAKTHADGAVTKAKTEAANLKAVYKVAEKKKP